MDIAGIKKIIKDNPRVILYFGADWEQFVNVNKATGFAYIQTTRSRGK